APPAEGDQAVVAAKFRTYTPPVFTGEEGPLAVRDWIRKMDCIFRMMGISDQHMVACAEYRSVEEYEQEFARKSAFARHLVDTDDKKASRFRNGLTRDLRVLVASHGYLTYAETVERAQQIEASQLLDTPAQPLAQVALLARQPAAIQPALPAPPQLAQHRHKRKWRGRDDRRNRRPGAPAQAAPPVPQPLAICATCQRAHRG
ncbi:Unknown protein, partial [Striga hermonthica]